MASARGSSSMSPGALLCGRRLAWDATIGVHVGAAGSSKSAADAERRRSPLEHGAEARHFECVTALKHHSLEPTWLPPPDPVPCLLLRYASRPSQRGETLIAEGVRLFPCNAAMKGVA